MKDQNKGEMLKELNYCKIIEDFHNLNSNEPIENIEFCLNKLYADKNNNSHKEIVYSLSFIEIVGSLELGLYAFKMLKMLKDSTNE